MTNEELYCPNCKQKVMPVKKVVGSLAAGVAAFVLSLILFGILWGLILFPVWIAIAYLFASKQCPKCGHKFK